jgi:hypothetical protein
LTSSDLFAAMSVMILPPVRNASRPTALTPFHRRGLMVQKRPLKNCLYRYRVVGREKTCIWVLPHLQPRGPPGEGSTVSRDPSLRVRVTDVCVYILYARRRRKCRTTLEGDVLSLILTRSPSVVKISIRLS